MVKFYILSINPLGYAAAVKTEIKFKDLSKVFTISVITYKAFPKSLICFKYGTFDPRPVVYSD